MTSVLIREETNEKGRRHAEEKATHMKTEAEIGAMHLQGKECPEFPAIDRSWEKGME